MPAVNVRPLSSFCLDHDCLVQPGLNHRHWIDDYEAGELLNISVSALQKARAGSRANRYPPAYQVGPGTIVRYWLPDVLRWRAGEPGPEGGSHE